LARSSTTFKPGHTAGFQPGNTLALRHGALSKSNLEARYPALRERLEAELAENPLPNQRVDDAQKRRWVFMAAQAESLSEYYEATGGMWTSSGAERPGVEMLMKVYDRLEKLERSMGIGQLARAQVIQAAAAGRRDVADVQARYARMRAKQQLAIVS
jgi:hypothetical protein